MTTKNNTPVIVQAPRNYIVHPVFPAIPTEKERIVQVSNGDVYVINGNQNDVPEEKYKSVELSVDHLQLLLALLYLRETQKPTPKEEDLVYCTIDDLCTLTGREINGKQSRFIRGLVKDLRDCEFSIKSKDDKNPYIYHVLKDFNFVSESKGNKAFLKRLASRNGQEEFDFAKNIDSSRKSKIWITKEFLPLLSDTIGINITVMSQIKSKLGKLFYAYITSRACHCSKENPWQINLLTLFQNIGLDVKNKYRLKSVRAKTLTQSKVSILDRLNGAETQHKTVLKIKMEDNSEGDDYKLICWVEKEEQEQRYASKLLDHWLDMGGNPATYQKCRKRENELHPDIFRKFQYLGIDLLGNERSLMKYWQLMYNLMFTLDPRGFDEVLSQVVADQNEGRISIKDSGKLITKAMIERMKQEFSAKRK